MILNGFEQYNELIQRMNREPYIATPILRDLYRHRAVNPVLCVGYTFENGDFYMMSVSHSDAPRFEVPAGKLELDAAVLAYVGNYDIKKIEEFYSIYVNDTRNLFANVKDCNQVIPITVWSTVVKQYHDHLWDIIRPVLTKENHAIYKVIKNQVATLRQIETAGLKVDVETFDAFFENKMKRYVTDGLVYSEYYPFTITGRPSNRFGGINFAALNKNDGSRSAFISRFAGGQLLQLDFESYHLRLIGNYMGIELPNEPVHQYLAKLYFNKDQITQDEYEQGKQMTFGILYGADVETDIPLLNSIKQLSKQIYTEYQSGGLKAPISGRTINISGEDATENKLFNYFVQCYEFETTVPKLQGVLDFLQDKQSQLILYTYDAVLLDCHPDEMRLIAGAFNDLLTQQNKFPVRASVGPNYNELKSL